MAEEAKVEAKDSKQKMVKIFTRRAILVERKKTAHGIEGRIIPPGTEIEVTEEDAKDFCDRQFTGHYAFGGERQFGYDPKNPNSVIDPEGKAEATKMHDYRRAVRVA